MPRAVIARLREAALAGGGFAAFEVPPDGGADFGGDRPVVDGRELAEVRG